MADRRSHDPGLKFMRWLMATAAVGPVSLLAFHHPAPIDVLCGCACRLRNGSRSVCRRSGISHTSRDRQGEDECMQNLHCAGPRGMTKRYVMPTVQMLLLPAAV